MSKHYITVPNRANEISFYIEFGGTAVATVNTVINNAHKSRKFNFKKRSPYLLLFSRNKKSLIVVSHSDSVRLWVEKTLNETGLEKIATETLFEPIIKFEEDGDSLKVELMFSMAFENKETIIAPVIEFLRKLTEFLEM